MNLEQMMEQIKLVSIEYGPKIIVAIIVWFIGIWIIKMLNYGFGLGVTICSQDKNVVALADRFSDGAVFINELVKSDPRLPFGGTKKSGYGRELSKDGMLEFVNRKTVYVN